MQQRPREQDAERACTAAACVVMERHIYKHHCTHAQLRWQGTQAVYMCVFAAPLLLLLLLLLHS